MTSEAEPQTRDRVRFAAPLLRNAAKAFRQTGFGPAPLMAVSACPASGGGEPS
jgi:hypothetical protein